MVGGPPPTAVGNRACGQLNPARYPAPEIAVLDRERWEVESACFELKSTILDVPLTPGGEP
jgi:IS4 transposase